MCYVLPASSIILSHPDVLVWQSLRVSDGLVVAVMLRPLYGRTARMQVLAEVAESVRGYTDGTVYVVADTDVYQAILHEEAVDTRALSRRRGCYVLPHNHE